MLLKDGKTVLYFTVNAGFLQEAMRLVTELVPKFYEICGDNLYVGFGTRASNNPISASVIMRAISERKVYNAITQVDTSSGMSANLDEILKDMYLYHDFQDVDNLFFFSNYSASDICMVDMRAKRWINRRCFVAVGMNDETHKSAENYFHGMIHLLYNGKVMNADRLAFLLQFAQLEE